MVLFLQQVPILSSSYHNLLGIRQIEHIYPFHFSYKIISWKLISKCYIRKYDAISEFGGWGIKFSFLQKKRKSFTTKGNIGLQIELKSGQKILLGTQKKEELQRTLDNYNFTIF